MSRSGSRSRDLQPIIDRMVAGDETAIPALIDRSCDRLRKLTRKMLKSCPGVKPWEDTDDVLQGAAIRLHRSLEAVKPATVQAFIGLAAVQIRRQLIDLFRHYHGPEGHAANQAAEAPEGKSRQRVIRDKPDSSAGPSTLAEWTEFHEKVQRLPEVERQVFDLVYYQGLRQAEVASLLDISVRTVKRYWRDACISLHDLLGSKPGK